MERREGFGRQILDGVGHRPHCCAVGCASAGWFDRGNISHGREINEVQRGGVSRVMSGIKSTSGLFGFSGLSGGSMANSQNAQAMKNNFMGPLGKSGESPSSGSMMNPYGDLSQEGNLLGEADMRGMGDMSSFLSGLTRGYANGGPIPPEHHKAILDAIDVVRQHLRVGGASKHKPQYDLNVAPSTIAPGSFDYGNSMRLYYDLINSGMKPPAAQGFAANFSHESNKGGQISPGAQETNPVKGGAGGLGEGQWTGARRNEFENFAKTTGQPVSDHMTSVNFLNKEISPGGDEYNRYINHIADQPTGADATKMVMKYYERPDVRYAHLDDRLGHSNEIGKIADAGNPFKGDALNQTLARWNNTGDTATQIAANNPTDSSPEFPKAQLSSFTPTPDARPKFDTDPVVWKPPAEIADKVSAQDAAIEEASDPQTGGDIGVDDAGDIGGEEYRRGGRAHFAEGGYDDGAPDETSQRAFLDKHLYEQKPEYNSPLVEQQADRSMYDVNEANNDRPSSNASEFVRHQLDKPNDPQLPQFDREAKDRWKYGAADALHGMAYFTPAAPVVGAYDAYEGLKSGDPYEAALGATGLPGKYAKAGTMAMAAMMPSDAEASPKSKAIGVVKDLAGKALGQKISSAETSLNQVPALFKSKHFEVQPEGHRNLDIGGGKYDLGTDHLASRGIESHVFDPYNRTPEHNASVMERFRDNPADSVTAANVLNVIQEPEVRSAVIKGAKNNLRPGGKAYFSIYEGSKSGEGVVTPKGWQENRPAASYIPEVQEHFPVVDRKGNILIASHGAEPTVPAQPKASTPPAAAILEKTPAEKAIEIGQDRNGDPKAYKQAVHEAEQHAINNGQRRVTRGSEVLERNPNIQGNMDEVISKSKIPFADLEYEWTPTGLMIPKKTADLEDLVRQRALVTPALGDISPAETIIHRVGDTELPRPTVTHGGGDYQRGRHSMGPNPAGWASRDTMAKVMHDRILKNAADEAAKDPRFSDSPIVLSHTAMGYPSLDSTHIVRHNVLGQIEANAHKMDKTAVEQFDAFMRKKLGDDWPGMLNTEAVERYLAHNGKATSVFVQGLDGVKRFKAGFPNIAAARFAAMHPKLMGADQLASGYSMALLDRNAGTTRTAFHGPSRHTRHPTYDRRLPSAGYIGGTKYQIPSEIMFPDWWKAQKTIDKNGDPTTLTNYQQSMMTQNPVQRATQEWLDNIMRHQEKTKKAWGYRDGGKVRIHF